VENFDRVRGKTRLLIARLYNESFLNSDPPLSTQQSERKPQMTGGEYTQWQ